jgi:signal transduction histidine kinase
MAPPNNIRIIAIYKTFSKYAGISAIIIGISVFIGWGIDNTFLKSIYGDWVTMKPTTSLCFVLEGISLLLLQGKENYQKKIPGYIYLCSGIVAIIGMGVMTENIFDVDLGIDELLFKEKIIKENIPHHGRMAFFTALCFSLTSISLIMAGLEARARKHVYQYAAIVVTILSFMALLDYLFWATDIYDVLGYTKMSIHTALGFLLLSLGILFMWPERGIMKIASSDTLGGRMLRVLFPKIILTLIALTELRYIGEQLGYYDVDFGAALSAVISIIVISYIMWRLAKSLTNEDLTRKKVENELLKTNKRLLKQTKRLEASNRELAQFAYIASHDLQEPLKTIANYATLFEAKYKGSLDENADTYLEFLMGATMRMKLLVNDLLDFSRIGSVKEIGELDCNKLIQEVLTDMDASVRESSAMIEVKPLPLLLCYPDIKQLFQHLISNAIKYRKPGRPLKIVISAESQGDRWRFSVKDNGIGIEKAYYERIFVLFQKLHAREDYPGTGIGLALCKKIAELHDGKIWVESEPGEGSTFYFTISKHLKEGEEA